MKDRDGGVALPVCQTINLFDKNTTIKRERRNDIYIIHMVSVV